MNISNNRIVVEKIEEEKAEGGFEIVNVQDSFIYRAKVVVVPEAPIHMGNKQVGVGDTVLFAKHSPDTHELDHEGKKLKFVKVEDIMAVL